MEPILADRPDVLLWYKIEDREYFIMDRAGYLAIRDYILTLEGSLGFAINEIRESNKIQDNVLNPK